MKFGLESWFNRKPELCIGDVVVVVWLAMALVGLWSKGWL